VVVRVLCVARVFFVVVRALLGCFMVARWFCIARVLLGCVICVC